MRQQCQPNAAERQVIMLRQIPQGGLQERDQRKQAEQQVAKQQIVD
jgi:hypothetical protein